MQLASYVEDKYKIQADGILYAGECVPPSTIQKAFMRAANGCTEHHLKLASMLVDAKIKLKSLIVAWLDLVNAYGSVHHSLWWESI